MASFYTSYEFTMTQMLIGQWQDPCLIREQVLQPRPCAPPPRDRFGTLNELSSGRLSPRYDTSNDIQKYAVLLQRIRIYARDFTTATESGAAEYGQYTHGSQPIPSHKYCVLNVRKLRSSSFDEEQVNARIADTRMWR